MVSAQFSHDDGALEGYVLLALLGLTGFATVVMVISSMFIRVEQAQSAAQLGALAAAATGSCEVGAEAVARNGASILDCRIEDSHTAVTVSVPAGLGRLLTSAGAPRAYRVTARAAA